MTIGPTPALWHPRVRGGSNSSRSLPTTCHDLRYCRHAPPVSYLPSTGREPGAPRRPLSRRGVSVPALATSTADPHPPHDGRVVRRLVMECEPRCVAEDGPPSAALALLPPHATAAHPCAGVRPAVCGMGPGSQSGERRLVRALSGCHLGDVAGGRSLRRARRRAGSTAAAGTSPSGRWNRSSTRCSATRWPSTRARIRGSVCARATATT